MTNTPQIRFNGFDEEWEEKKLGDVCEINPHSELPSVFEYVDLESVFGTEMLSHRTEFKETAPSRAQRLAKKGDVFYQTVRPYQKNNYFYNKDANNYVFSTGYAQLRSEMNGRFLLSILQSNRFVETVLENCTGTSYPAINPSTLGQLKVFFPSPLEQTKIGELFSKIDTLITSTQKEYDKLVALKKSMLQKMFPKKGSQVPEIRFKGFTDEWVEKKLGDVADMYSGGTPSAGNSEFYNGNIPFIRSGEINSDETELFLTETGLKESSAKIVKKGNLLYALYGATSGEVGIAKFDGAINQAILAINLYPNYDIYFVHSWLRNNKKIIVDTFLQGGQGNLSGDIVKQFKICFPSYSEQQKIGTYFQNLDNLISKQSMELEKLKTIKNTLLGKMFV